jgi:hypothetical protein
VELDPHADLDEHATSALHLGAAASGSDLPTFFQLVSEVMTRWILRGSPFVDEGSGA